MNNLTTIYVIRHGESKYNAELSGESNSNLTELGIEQVKGVAEELKDVKFAAVFSSTLVRAKETAEILKLERKLTVEARQSIIERSSYQYADLIGRDEKEILEEMKKDLKFLDEEAKMQYKHTPQMESPQDAAVRFLTFLREIAIAYRGENVLVVSHGNLMRNTLTHLGHARYDELPAGAISNAGYFVLKSDGIDFLVKKTSRIVLHDDKPRIW